MAEQGNLGHISDAEAATVVYAPGLDPELEARVLSHVASCADCGRRLEALRVADRSIGELLSSLDVPAPGTSAAALMRTARAPRRQIFVTSRRHAAAAVIAFMVVAAAAAAAIPASPLHRFVVRALSGEKGAAAAIRSRGSEPASAPSSAVSFSAGSSLDVVFEGRGTGGAVHLRITDADQVSLSSADSGATYRVGSNRITVNQSAPANFELQIPRSLGELRILVGGKVIFERRPGKPMSTDTLTIPFQ